MTDKRRKELVKELRDIIEQKDKEISNLKQTIASLMQRKEQYTCDDD